jgi:hypothetical protein
VCVCVCLCVFALCVCVLLIIPLTSVVSVLLVAEVAVRLCNDIRVRE